VASDRVVTSNQRIDLPFFPKSSSPYPAPRAVDAIVVASAASRGDIIYSSDVHDLERLRHVFPGVRILGA